MSSKTNVKELVKNGETYIVKSVTCPEKRVLLQDEINNLKRIQSKEIPGVIKCVYANANDEECVLVTRKVSGFYNFSNVRSLLASCIDVHDLWFREILFQILYSVACLQFFFPGFRHNDLKADNVLLDVDLNKKVSNFSWPPPSPHFDRDSTTTRKWTLNSGIKTLLIDFEVSSSRGDNEDHLKSRSHSYAPSMFGLSSERCDMFDIHLLFAELRLYAPFKSWGPSFILFCNDFFDTSMFDSPIYSTSQSRLNLDAQQTFMTTRWTLYDNFLLRLLSHDYFGHLRTD